MSTIYSSKIASRTFKILFCVLLIGCGISGRAIGQVAVPKIDISKIDFEVMRSPQFGNLASQLNIKNRNSKEKEWLEIFVEFELEMPRNIPARARKAYEVVDNLKFNYYVHFSGDGDLRRQVFTGTVSHVNILAGEPIISSMYLSPSALIRIFGAGTNITKNKVDRVGVEVEFQGQIVARSTDRGDNKAWWQLPGVQKVPGLLKNRSETPFYLLFWDLFAEIEPQRR